MSLLSEVWYLYIEMLLFFAVFHDVFKFVESVLCGSKGEVREKPIYLKLVTCLISSPLLFRLHGTVHVFFVITMLSVFFVLRSNPFSSLFLVATPKMA